MGVWRLAKCPTHFQLKVMLRLKYQGTECLFSHKSFKFGRVHLVCLFVCIFVNFFVMSFSSSALKYLKGWGGVEDNRLKALVLNWISLPDKLGQNYMDFYLLSCVPATLIIVWEYLGHSVWWSTLFVMLWPRYKSDLLAVFMIKIWVHLCPMSLSWAHIHIQCL